MQPRCSRLVVEARVLVAEAEAEWYAFALFEDLETNKNAGMKASATWKK
jgi:hypothetical protein